MQDTLYVFSGKYTAERHGPQQAKSTLQNCRKWECTNEDFCSLLTIKSNVCGDLEANAVRNQGFRDHPKVNHDIVSFAYFRIVHSYWPWAPTLKLSGLRGDATANEMPQAPPSTFTCTYMARSTRRVVPRMGGRPIQPQGKQQLGHEHPWLPSAPSDSIHRCL
jgi:hypothetical protein